MDSGIISYQILSKTYISRKRREECNK